MPEKMPENPIKEGAEKLEATIKKEPWYVWAGAAAAAGMIVYFVWRKQASASSAAPADTTAAGTTAADGAALNGFSVDSMAGLPFGQEAGGYNYQGGPVDNYPFQETQSGGSTVPIVPAGVNPIYDSSGGLVGFQEPSAGTPQSPAPAPTAAPVTQTGQIRNRVGNKGSSNGVPFLAAPGGSVLSNLQYGSHVAITGAPVSGPNNSPRSGGAGSNLWFPVKSGNSSGYVSAYDVVNILAAGSGGGGQAGDDGGFHLAVNANRNTVDQWTFQNGMHKDFDSTGGANGMV